MLELKAEIILLLPKISLTFWWNIYESFAWYFSASLVFLILDISSIQQMGEGEKETKQDKSA